LTLTFFERLEARARAIGSPLCVGLDPHADELGAPDAALARDLCLRLIEATAPYAAAFKPNAAFFEALGAPGVAALREVIAAVPDEIPVILDAKRGDIASTARAYATAAYEALGADAVTLSPYLGRDAVLPFVEDPTRGAFVLCSTSNPGAGELQGLQVSSPGEPPMALFERVARDAPGWSPHPNIGLVIGATQVEHIARARRLAPQAWILAPGVGAQGGELAEALRAGLRPDGLGVLLPVSRGISRAADPASAARALRDAARAVAPPALPPDGPRERLADALLDAGCVRFGAFTLKSGLQSPLYIDLRRIIGAPALLQQVAAAYLEPLSALSYDVIAALPYAALPIGAAVSLLSNKPLIYPRREAKSYGTRAEVEGVFEPRQRAVVLDDLATTGGSKLEALEKLQSVGLEVTDVVVLIDRQSGGAAAMAQVGCALHAVFTLTWLLDHWERRGRITTAQANQVRAFLGYGEG
jgi:uridine monophosphate synthetase